MFAEYAMWVFLSIGAVALFSFLSVMSWVDCRRREREAYYRSESIRKISEMPGATPASMQELLREQQSAADRRVREGLKVAGLITAGVGVGIIVFLRALVDSPVYLAGLIPLMVGMALLAYIYLLAPSA